MLKQSAKCINFSIRDWKENNSGIPTEYKFSRTSSINFGKLVALYNKERWKNHAEQKKIQGSTINGAIFVTVTMLLENLGHLQPDLSQPIHTCVYCWTDRLLSWYEMSFHLNEISDIKLISIFSIRFLYTSVYFGSHYSFYCNWTDSRRRESLTFCGFLCKHRESIDGR